MSSQTLRFNYSGETSASSGSVIAPLRLPTYSGCLLAVTADEPSRRFLLWGQQQLLPRPIAGSSSGSGDSKLQHKNQRLSGSDLAGLRATLKSNFLSVLD